MSFDPEKVERFDCSRHEGMVWADPGDYVPSGDYDQLLQLYREEKAKNKYLDSNRPFGSLSTDI